MHHNYEQYGWSNSSFRYASTCSQTKCCRHLVSKPGYKHGSGFRTGNRPGPGPGLEPGPGPQELDQDQELYLDQEMNQESTSTRVRTVIRTKVRTRIRSIQSGLRNETGIDVKVGKYIDKDLGQYFFHLSHHYKIFLKILFSR